MLSALYALLAGLFAVAAGGGGGGGGTTSSSTAAGSTTSGGMTPPAAPSMGGSGDDDDDDAGGSAAAAPDTPAPITPPAASTPSGDTVYIPDIDDDEYDLGWGGLSAEEQLIVELVNRARMDPVGELSYQDDGFAAGVSTSPVQPVAVLGNLSESARAHSQDMDDRNFFSHTNPDGQSPTARAAEEGYEGGGVGENIGWAGSFSIPDEQARATEHHNSLWDSDGHQQNFMNPGWSEIGVGYVYGDYTYNGTTYPASTFVTEVFGDDGKTFLTGVVIDDADGDDFYDLGEGQGDVNVTAYNADGTYATSTWESGGYTLELPPGTYTLVFHGGDLDGVYETSVTIGSENVKLDVIEDDDAIDADVVATSVLTAMAGDEGGDLMAELALSAVPDEIEEPEDFIDAA